MVEVGSQETGRSIPAELGRWIKYQETERSVSRMKSRLRSIKENSGMDLYLGFANIYELENWSYFYTRWSILFLFCLVDAIASLTQFCLRGEQHWAENGRLFWLMRVARLSCKCPAWLAFYLPFVKTHAPIADTLTNLLFRMKFLLHVHWHIGNICSHPRQKTVMVATSG